MAETGAAEVLLAHLERDLGEYGGRGVAKAEWELDFSVLTFEAQPEPGVAAHVTFGISTHVVAANGDAHRQELLVLARDAWAEEAVQIAANVGAYVVDRHVALIEGETVGMPFPAIAPDRLVVAQPAPFPERLARCTDFDPPVALVWLLPFFSSEHHIVAEHGWRALLEAVHDARADPYDLARDPVL